MASRGSSEPSVWEKKYMEYESAWKDTNRNLIGEQRMLNFLNNKLANNDFSTGESSNSNNLTKRRLEESSNSNKSTKRRFEE